MAGKGRRAAARQGELSRRRKRGQRAPSGSPSTNPPGTPVQQPTNGSGATLAMEAAGAVAAASTVAEPVQSQAVAAAPAPQPVTPPRGQGRQRGERPAAYNYVGAEVRRIGVLTTGVAAALVALSFVL